MEEEEGFIGGVGETFGNIWDTVRSPFISDEEKKKIDKERAEKDKAAEEKKKAGA